MDKSVKPSSMTLTSDSNHSQSKPKPTVVGSTLSSDSENDDDEVSCDVCKTTFSGSIPFEQHLKGHKHRKMLKKLEMKKRYAKKVNKPEENSQTSFDISRDADDVEDETLPEILCELCNKTCLGYICYQQHLKGRKHAKKVKQVKLIEKMNLDQKSARGGVPNENQTGVDSSLYEILPHFKPFAYCEVCNKKFTGPETYQQHNESDVHRKAVINKELTKKIQNADDVHVEDRAIDAKIHAIQKDPSGIDDDVLEVKPFAECCECKKKFTGPVPYQQHMISDAHKKMLAKRHLLDKMKTILISDLEDDTLTCKDCNKSFNGPEPFQQHLKSEAHEKQKTKEKLRKSLLSEHPEMAKEQFRDIEYEALVKENEMNRNSNLLPLDEREYLMCEVCHKCFTGPESARDHFVSKRHIKALKEKEKLRLLRQRSRGGSHLHLSESSENKLASEKVSPNFDEVEGMDPKQFHEGRQVDSMKTSSKVQKQGTQMNEILVKQIPPTSPTNDKSRIRTSNSFSSDVDDFEMIS